MNRILLTVALFLIGNIAISQETQQPNKPKAELKSKSIEQKKSQGSASTNAVVGHPNLVKAKFSAKNEMTTESDFPVFIDTGNPAADNADYATRKQAWIAANPEKYDAMITPNGPAADRNQPVKYSK